MTVNIFASFSYLSEVEGGDGKEDKEEKVSFLDMLKLNIPDWHVIIPGIIGSALVGALLPCLSILFSEALQVSVTSLL